MKVVTSLGYMMVEFLYLLSWYLYSDIVQSSNRYLQSTNEILNTNREELVKKTLDTFQILVLDKDGCVMHLCT